MSLTQLQLILRQTNQIIALIAVSPVLAEARIQENWVEPAESLQKAQDILSSYDAQITFLRGLS